MAITLEAHEQIVRRWLARGSMSPGSDVVPFAAARLYEMLFQSLAPVVGAEAVCAMLARSAKVSRDKHPCLGGLLPETGASGDVTEVAQRIRASLSSERPDLAAEAATALYTALLRLMTTLIGERVTSQIVSSAFEEMETATSKEMK